MKLNTEEFMWCISATICALLHWRTFNRSITAIYAAVTWFGFQYPVALFAGIEIGTCISGHGFFFLISTPWTGDNGL
jgi:hypothetical protein